MRPPRTKPHTPTLYHCISRLVAGVPYLAPHEKDFFRRRLRRLAQFHDMTLLTHSIMSNHFHVLARTPDRKQPPSDEQLLKKLRRFYGPKSQPVEEFQRALAGPPARLNPLRARYRARIGDLSAFMKELKEGFSRWYNRRHERCGTLWAERFKSPTVQQTLPMVLTVAAYIDLNAVRAGMVGDPKDYRFCGYAEAVAGQKEAKAGLGAFLPPGPWPVRMAEYRKYLFGTAGRASRAGQAVLDPKRIAKVIEKGGKVSVPEALRLRVRYFTAGVVIGSQEFVDAYWRKYLKKPGSKRKTGARKMKGADWGEMRVLRDLKKDVIG